MTALGGESTDLGVTSHTVNMSSKPYRSQLLFWTRGRNVPTQPNPSRNSLLRATCHRPQCTNLLFFLLHVTCHHSETSDLPEASPWSDIVVEVEAPLNPPRPSLELRYPEWHQSCCCCSSARSRWTACRVKSGAAKASKHRCFYTFLRQLYTPFGVKF